MKRRIQVNGCIIFISVLLMIFFPAKFLRFTHGVLDEVLEIFGLAFMLLGLLVRVSSRGFKSEHSQSGNYLVQDGPYGLVRNPMYLGIFSIALGVIMMLFQWWALLLFIVFFVTRYVPLIIKEERVLIKNFGEQYLQYQNEVPRLFPHVSILLKRGVFKYMPLKLIWIKKEMSSIFILLVGSATVEFCEDIKCNRVFSLSHMVGFLVVIGIFISFSLFLSKHYEGISK